MRWASAVAAEADFRAAKAEAKAAYRDLVTGDAAARAEMYRSALQRAVADGMALTRELQSAHFRNPATGRLGRKGQRFTTG